MRRNIPTKEPLGVIVPQATLDFVMRPRKVPHPEARSLEEYKKACQDHFLHLLIIALKDRALPERTRLAHCVARDSHSTTDFSYQAVCQGIRNPCMEVAAAFTHITESLSRPNGHPSSHQRARDMGDTSIGNIIIFSSTPACSITQCLPFPAHACHVGLQLVENVKVPIDVVREDFHPNTGTDKGIWLFDLPNCVVKYRNHETKDILDAKSSARVLHSPKAFAHRPSIVEASKTANEATKILLADILKDQVYLNRVAILAQYGQIIICAPQVVFYGKDSEQNAVYDSGLTLLLEGDEPASLEELLQIYIVSRSLAQFLASVYGLVRDVARTEKQKTIELLSRALSHEIGNLGGILKVKLDEIEMTQASRLDFDARIDIADRAARAVCAQLEDKHEALSDQFAAIVTLYDQLDDFSLHWESHILEAADVSVSKVFCLALNEMLRNAYKHSLDLTDPGTTNCSLRRSKQKIVLEVSNNCTADNHALVTGLLNEPEPDDKGLKRLRELVSMLPHGSVSARAAQKGRITVHLQFDIL